MSASPLLPPSELHDLSCMTSSSISTPASTPAPSPPMSPEPPSPQPSALISEESPPSSEWPEVPLPPGVPWAKKSTGGATTCSSAPTASRGMPSTACCRSSPEPSAAPTPSPPPTPSLPLSLLASGAPLRRPGCAAGPAPPLGAPGSWSPIPAAAGPVGSPAVAAARRPPASAADPCEGTTKRKPGARASAGMSGSGTADPSLSSRVK
mmetsp:Transcript_42106/g.126012  ORF Transcript_42106/g.126012 Transcript_42106/m.126012 type:complete len:208 (-) Transcript_42106:101-724(-)